jgi:ribosomal-protein-serine acetyltransferase
MFANTITTRLFLRVLCSADAPALFALTDSNRMDLEKWLPWVSATRSTNDSLRFIESSQEQLKSRNGFQLGIWFETQLFGVIGIHQIDWENLSTSVGYWLGCEYRGMGIMTTCCAVLLDHIFRGLNLNRVEIRCGSDNTKSRAIPERLGFRIDGTLREAEIIANKRNDLVVYSLLSAEWKSGRRSHLQSIAPYSNLISETSWDLRAKTISS